jgi:hypothetical protein
MISSAEIYDFVAINGRTTTYLVVQGKSHKKALMYSAHEGFRDLLFIN